MNNSYTNEHSLYEPLKIESRIKIKDVNMYSFGILEHLKSGEAYKILRASS